MNDTTPEAALIWKQRLAEQSDARRLLMTLRMFDFARTLARAGILYDEPGLTETQVQQRLFERFYRGDLPDARVDEIIEKIGRGELGTATLSG